MFKISTIDGMRDDLLESRLEKAFEARQSLIDPEHHHALRLYSGFYEGDPDLVIDLYGQTLVLNNFRKSLVSSVGLLDNAQAYALERFPWITCAIQKTRYATDNLLKHGKFSFGDNTDPYVVENGIRYAVNLRMNQDASFYIDTRNLRTWLSDNSAGKSVLNTFAYSGSLGVAALAGGAKKVVQVDRNATYLSLARQSAALNHLDLGKMKLRAADFFNEMGRFKQEGELFDIALLDPPFFSVTGRGTVDMINESSRLINKIRPLVKDGGALVVINNALFLSGADYMNSLFELCRDGYLEVETIVPVPLDICGYPETIVSTGPVDPAPFNHATKIVVLRVKRKTPR
jgi:23S rRNA (cytosine1962-C5)-methyltransferase